MPVLPSYRNHEQTWREKKIDYVIDSYKKTSRTLLTLFFGTIVF